MKPTWDKLAQEFEDSTSILVGHVDCFIEDHIDMCGKLHNIQKIPTVKYGDPDAPFSMEEYNLTDPSSRTLEVMRTFIKENVKPQCGPFRLDLCNKIQKNQIAEFKAMSFYRLQSKINELEMSLENVNFNLNEYGQHFQRKLQEAIETKEAELKKFKEASNLDLMEMVAMHASEKTKHEL
eukprot:gnl/MRDRNA2_/MRDRNA2_272408_c0_seq1.p1 gnl/MRDRNA2_/MRDRNA2_272408_c0~~gnl/MRDRNA2_/MRDRNA2_272408_c0_seq1.p1  ORF type:complete len:206 (+),score=47.70 gnl/MRDRNA2_/MRDRNA2_272408_c0_seq1:79-618(+)